MKSIWTVAKKELLDLFRDRKTMMLGLFLGPIVMPALILGMGALAEKKMRTQLESTLELPVIGATNAKIRADPKIMNQVVTSWLLATSPFL